VNTTVRLPILVLLIFLGWTGASHSQGSSPAVAAVTQWGLLGDWATNCTGKDILHRVYLVRGGKVFAAFDEGEGDGIQGIGDKEITVARVTDQGTLAYREKQKSGTPDHIDYVITKVGADKKRELSVLFAPSTWTVKNGKYLTGNSSGQPTSVWTRCKKL
jgi:hypothetical protein